MEKTTVVKLSNEIVRQAKLVALVRDMPLAQYLADVTRETVHQDYNREINRLATTNTAAASKIGRRGMKPRA